MKFNKIVIIALAIISSNQLFSMVKPQTLTEQEYYRTLYGPQRYQELTNPTQYEIPAVPPMVVEPEPYESAPSSPMISEPGSPASPQSFIGSDLDTEK